MAVIKTPMSWNDKSKGKKTTEIEIPPPAAKKPRPFKDTAMGHRLKELNEQLEKDYPVNTLMPGPTFPPVTVCEHIAAAFFLIHDAEVRDILKNAIVLARKMDKQLKIYRRLFDELATLEE